MHIESALRGRGLVGLLVLAAGVCVLGCGPADSQTAVNAPTAPPAASVVAPTAPATPPPSAASTPAPATPHDPSAAPPDVAAPPANATITASGLAYVVLSPGVGTAHPTATSHVTVNYSGWTPDGNLFDTTAKRGKPVSFGLKSVIKGWTEGLQLMTKGEKARFWIPAALAYGDTPNQSGSPTGKLVFDVELIDFQ